MALRGDLGALPALARSLEARAGAVQALPERAAEAIAAVSAAQLRAGATPYGAPWPPKRDGGRALAHATVDVEARGLSVVASIEGPLVYHNAGTGHEPRRQILPTDGEGLPATWRAALDDVAAKALGEGR